MITRRALLAAAPALLVPRSGLAIAAAANDAASRFDPWIEVNAQNLRHNAGEVARLAGRRPVLAVVKNNGYGLGVANAARILEGEQGIAGFAVVTLHEAVTLRDAGIRKPILWMGPFTDEDLADAAARDIMPMVYRDHTAALGRAAARTGRRIALHVKVDTGMNRVGVPHAKAPALIRTLAASPSVRLEGIMTTLTEDEAFDREQLARFTALAASLARDGVRVGRRHAASSYALFRNPDTFLDMVRPGMALLGIYPEPAFRRTGVLDLRPAVALRARVALVKQLQPGESAGYNRAFMPKDPTWIATLPAGHADGWPRLAAKGARVRIGDRLYPVVASVSASHTIVDLGPRTAVSAGDVATLFDWTDGSRPEDVADACGASVYDLTMHLGALLPRRVVGM